MKQYSPDAPAGGAPAPTAPVTTVNPPAAPAPSSFNLESMKALAQSVAASAAKLTAKLDRFAHTCTDELDALNKQIANMSDHLNSLGKTASTTVASAPLTSRPDLTGTPLEEKPADPAPAETETKPAESAAAQ